MKAFHFRNKKKEINTEPTFDTEIPLIVLYAPLESTL